MTAEPVCVTHGTSGEHPNEDAPCERPGPAPAEKTPHPGAERATFEFSGSPWRSGMPVVNGRPLGAVKSVDVRIRPDEIPVVTLGLDALDVRLALGGDVAVGVTDETREALISLGWAPPGAMPEALAIAREDWTPEQVLEFQERWDSLASQYHVRWLPAGSRPLIVLTFCWTEDDGTPRQETYGPWDVAEDESHLEDITGFVREWRRLSGREPSAVTMALVQHPAAWAAARQQESEQ